MSNVRVGALNFEALDICRERVESRPEGGKTWRELYFAQPEGFRALTMTLSVPPGAGPHPLVIYIHGGGWRFGHPNVQNPVLADMQLTEHLIASGYAVARPSYRLSGEGKFPTQLHDCKAAVRYLRHHAEFFGLDADRIGALGESAGGHLAVMLGLKTPAEFEGEVGITGPSSAVRAVVNWYGVSNLLTLSAQALPDTWVDHDSANSSSSGLIGGVIPDNPEAARQASPISWVKKGASPCLIQHGTRDTIVPPGQGVELFEALQAAGVPSEIDLIESANHCFWDVDTSAIVPRAIRFFETYLR